MYLLAVNPSNPSFIYLCRLYFIAYLLSKFKQGILAMHLGCHLEKVTSYPSLWAWFNISSAWSQRHEFAELKLLVKPLKRSIFGVFFSLGVVISVTLPRSALRSFNQWYQDLREEAVINLQSLSFPLFISTEYLHESELIRRSIYTTR